MDQPPHNRRKLFIAAVLVSPMLFWGWALSKEARYTGFAASDLVAHENYTRTLIDYFRAGSLGLEAWETTSCLGAPIFRTYQNLAHYLAAGLASIGYGGDAARSVRWLLWLALVLQIPAFYFAARRFGLSRAKAAAGAWLVPLVASLPRHGHVLESYLFRGFGLFPQAAAFPAFAITLGCAAGISGWAGTSPRRPWRDGVECGFWLSLAFLLHHFLGYMALLCLAGFWSMGFLFRLLPRRALLRALVAAGLVSGVFTSYQLLSIAQDLPLMHHSVWHETGRWEGAGLGSIAREATSGSLLDHECLPLLSVLTLLGLVFALRPKAPRAERALVLFFSGALFLYAGRPTFGRAIDLIPGIGNLHLERALILFQVASVFLCANALGEIFERAMRSRRGTLLWLLAVPGALIVYRMGERYAVVARSAKEIAKQERLAPELDPRIFTALAPELRRGNLWALASADAFGLKLGSVPMMLMASSLGYSQVSYASHRLTYLSDMIAEFNPSVPVHYRIFNVTAVLKPTALTRPPFLREVFRAKDIESDAAPGQGPWDVVGTARPERTATPEAYLARVRAWLWSPLPERGVYASVVPVAIAARWPSAVAAASPRGTGDWGRVIDFTALERGESRATLESFRPGSFALFRASYHPRWRVTVNGHPVAPRWLTPGFLGFEIPLGNSDVRVAFPSDPLRSVLFVVSLFALLATLALLYAPENKTRALRRSPQRH